MRNRRTRAAGFALTALLTLTACSGEDMETKSEADATALVQQHADAIAGLVGTSLRNPETGPLPCTGKLGESSRSVYAIQGVYNIDAPDGEQPRAVITRVRTDWTAKGYTITDDRELGTYDAVLTAKTPDGYSLDLETVSPEAFAMILHSPCFRRP
ncbi:hypothetical protein [Actinoplanes flavus]|uniref:Lipoprotein n=1 Tax=Actinoplanes flavus TaxID=2820290 RepID=A0ABS3USE5_9ACTN|nr:hypothetical protein [Actinoplanes flavus]MBO3741500.1 hypothetical protein [Actinoplanes flavus]